MLFGQKRKSKNIQAISKGSDQTAHMRRLIWGSAGRTYHIVGNLMRQLICAKDSYKRTYCHIKQS